MFYQLMETDAISIYKTTCSFSELFLGDMNFFFKTLKFQRHLILCLKKQRKLVHILFYQRTI